MTENLADLQKQLAELNKAIELQKALDKLAKVPVSHRTMQKREALEQAFRKVK